MGAVLVILLAKGGSEVTRRQAIRTNWTNFVRMKAKLTLSLDKGTINEAKEYAAEHDTSLSQLIEQLLRTLWSEPRKGKKTSGKSGKLSAEVERLSGIIKLPKAFDVKKEYGDYLAKKYGV